MTSQVTSHSQVTTCITATLVYKFLQTGTPKYFIAQLSSYSNSYNTRRSQSGATFLTVPKFQPSIHKSAKQFGFSFAFLMHLQSGIHSLRMLVYHPMLPLSEESSRPTYTPRLFHLNLFAYPVSLWCRPPSVPGL